MEPFHEPPRQPPHLHPQPIKPPRSYSRTHPSTVREAKVAPNPTAPRSPQRPRMVSQTSLHISPDCVIHCSFIVADKHQWEFVVTKFLRPDCCVHCILACLFCEFLTLCNIVLDCATCGSCASDDSCFCCCCASEECGDCDLPCDMDCGIIDACCESADCLEICMECCGLCFSSWNSCRGRCLFHWFGTWEETQKGWHPMIRSGCKPSWSCELQSSSFLNRERVSCRTLEVLFCNSLYTYELFLDWFLLKMFWWVNIGMILNTNTSRRLMRPLRKAKKTFVFVSDLKSS